MIPIITGGLVRGRFRDSERSHGIRVCRTSSGEGTSTMNYVLKIVKRAKKVKRNRSKCLSCWATSNDRFKFEIEATYRHALWKQNISIYEVIDSSENYQYACLHLCIYTSIY